MTYNWTTLRVSDLDKSIAFYNGLLGLPIAQRFGPPGHEIAMMGEADVPKIELLCGGEVPANAGAGVSMGFTPDNMAEMLERLKKEGYEPTTFSPNPALRFYFVNDPDGYAIQLVENSG